VKLTPEKLTAFCAALAETCNVGRACAAVDISRQTAYGWREQMPDFAERWDKALKVGASLLEDEAVRRAHDGVDEPMTYQGRFCPLLDAEGKPVIGPDGRPVIATVKKYSDTLLIFLLKARDPDRFRDNAKLELGGHLALGAMSDDEMRQELAALAAAGVIPAAG
jgi:hypothetical protein